MEQHFPPKPNHGYFQAHTQTQTHIQTYFVHLPKNPCLSWYLRRFCATSKCNFAFVFFSQGKFVFFFHLVLFSRSYFEIQIENAIFHLQLVRQTNWSESFNLIALLSTFHSFICKHCLRSRESVCTMCKWQFSLVCSYLILVFLRQPRFSWPVSSHGSSRWYCQGTFSRPIRSALLALFDAQAASSTNFSSSSSRPFASLGQLGSFCFSILVNFSFSFFLLFDLIFLFSFF